MKSKQTKTSSDWNANCCI